MPSSIRLQHKCQLDLNVMSVVVIAMILVVFFHWRLRLDFGFVLSLGLRQIGRLWRWRLWFLRVLKSVCLATYARTDMELLPRRVSVGLLLAAGPGSRGDCSATVACSGIETAPRFARGHILLRPFTGVQIDPRWSGRRAIPNGP